MHLRERRATPTSAIADPAAATHIPARRAPDRVVVGSIVAGVVAAVLALCIFAWVFYTLHKWWAVRAEALRPRGDGESPNFFSFAHCVDLRVRVCC